MHRGRRNRSGRQQDRRTSRDAARPCSVAAWRPPQLIYRLLNDDAVVCALLTCNVRCKPVIAVLYRKMASRRLWCCQWNIV